jgi:hypothetical protein
MASCCQRVIDLVVYHPVRGHESEAPQILPIVKLWLVNWILILIATWTVVPLKPLYLIHLRRPGVLHAISYTVVVILGSCPNARFYYPPKIEIQLRSSNFSLQCLAGSSPISSLQLIPPQFPKSGAAPNNLGYTTYPPELIASEASYFL